MTLEEQLKAIGIVIEHYKEQKKSAASRGVKSKLQAEIKNCERQRAEINEKMGRAANTYSNTKELR